MPLLPPPPHFRSPRFLGSPSPSPRPPYSVPSLSTPIESNNYKSGNQIACPKFLAIFHQVLTVIEINVTNLWKGKKIFLQTNAAVTVGVADMSYKKFHHFFIRISLYFLFFSFFLNFKMQFFSYWLVFFLLNNFFFFFEISSPLSLSVHSLSPTSPLSKKKKNLKKILFSSIYSVKSIGRLKTNNKMRSIKIEQSFLQSLFDNSFFFRFLLSYWTEKSTKEKG